MGGVQIYYWTGLLSFDAENSCLMWKVRVLAHPEYPPCPCRPC